MSGHTHINSPAPEQKPSLTSVLTDCSVRTRLFPPGRGMTEFVHAYWTLDIDAPPTEVAVVADGLVDLVFDMDDTGQSWVSGPPAESTTYTHTRATHLLGVGLYPDAARRLLGTGLQSLAPNWQPLSDYLGDHAHGIAATLAGANTTDERLSVLDDFLHSRLDDGVTDDRVRLALTAIRSSRGMARVDAVSRDAHTTPRQLARLFSEWIGLSPKQFARITRAQEAVNRMRSPGKRTLATIAAELNFSDHAHMSREIRALTGDNPSRLRTNPSETFKR